MNEDAGSTRDRRGSPGEPRTNIDSAISPHAFGRLRVAMRDQRGDRLCSTAKEILHEICSQARLRGVAPEQIIARVKDEIRSIAQFADDRDAERTRLELAVTSCIHSFYMTPSQHHAS